MPATITHAYFGEDLYNNLPSNIKRKINYDKTTLMMFSQSTDPLMFYNIYFPIIGKSYRKLHSKFHTTNTNKYFSILINYMKEKKYYDNPECLVFLYGLIAHFCLDTTTHPYIFYKSGLYNRKNKKTYKYRGLHHYMESYIDNYFLKTRNNNERINIKKFCFNIKPFSNELNNSINYSFDKTFNIKKMHKVYYKSLKQMKTFIFLFRLDYIGIKKYLYNIIDILTLRKIYPFKAISYNLDNFNQFDFLNMNNNTWYYPVDKSISSKKNFQNLYNHALIEAINIIKEINTYFFKNKKINIENLFKNKSYETGIDCNLEKKQKFFEF